MKDSTHDSKSGSETEKKPRNRRTSRRKNDASQNQHHTNGGSNSVNNNESNNNSNLEKTNVANKKIYNNSRKYKQNKKRNNKNDNKKLQYPDYSPLRQCLDRYAKKDKKLVRGKLRVIPGGAMAFVSCDRGSYARDVVIDGEFLR